MYSSRMCRLATAIGRLLEDPELRLRLTDAAAAFVESTCSVDAMIAGYCAVYSEAVGRRRARSTSLRAGASPSK